MKKEIYLFVVLILIISFTFSSCSPIDNSYGVSSEVEQTVYDDSVKNTKIMSSDRVMSKYFDISLFDEENYSDIYLGKKFKLSAFYNGQQLSVPTKLSELEKIGWNLAEGNIYDKKSLVFSYETIDLMLTNENAINLSVQLYNSSRSSVKLSDCYVVKYLIQNDFYINHSNYNEFNINGITNSMAITDIIDILGTPSHFYKVSDNSYYLDYFITKKDRRNGITIYINPIEDIITGIEFSFYK